MDKDLQYRAMNKLLNSLVKPEFEKIIDEIKVVPSTKMSKNTPTVKVYLTPNLLHYVSVENSSGVSYEDIQELTDNIDWKITEALKHLGSPRYWIEFIQIQP
jgi:hypothetical protein